MQNIKRTDSDGNSTPLLPFTEMVAPAKKQNISRASKRGAARRTSEASQQAFEAIKASRQRLYLPILKLIELQGSAPSDCLTAREILRLLKASGLLSSNAERNQISPRLTELLEAGCLENPADPAKTDRVFLKRVSGEAAASVWRITARGQLLIEELERRL